ncbi:MAG: hypothetical protein AAF149_07355 [Bacteroidota bacterium]
MQKARVYKGIHYVRISDLPEEQQIQIKNIESRNLIIKILTESELMSDCITYDDYRKWYQNIYTQVSPIEVEVANEPQKVSFMQWLKHRLLPNT